MEHELQFERVQPSSVGWGDAITRPWIIVLSEWVPGDTQKLIQRIEGLFASADSSDRLPTVFAIDNTGERAPSHRQLLTGLTEAGAIILEPEDNSEGNTVQHDPLSFVHQQVAFAMQAPANPGALASEPSKPDGYKEFATPCTRLSEDELKDLIEGRRSDDWRYQT